MNELPTTGQPPGFVVLFRAERPPNCVGADRATDIIPGGSRGRWFTTSLDYARSHLSPRGFAGMLRGALGIPWVQQPLKHPERYGDDAVWRVKAICLPADVAMRYWCENDFSPTEDGRALYRTVQYPAVLRQGWRRWLRGRGPIANKTLPYLLPAFLAAQATVLIEGGHLECWEWAQRYIDRGAKPVPVERVNVDLAILQATRPEMVERLDTVIDAVPAEWQERACRLFPSVTPFARLLEGEDQDDVLRLAEEMDAKLQGMDSEAVAELAGWLTYQHAAHPYAL